MASSPLLLPCALFQDSLELDGSIELNFSGWASWEDFYLLVPSTYSNCTLCNKLQLGSDFVNTSSKDNANSGRNNQGATTKPLDFNTFSNFTLNGINYAIDFSISLSNLTILFDVLAEINQAAFANLQLYQLTGACLASSFSNASLTFLNLSVSDGHCTGSFHGGGYDQSSSYDGPSGFATPMNDAFNVFSGGTMAAVNTWMADQIDSGPHVCAGEVWPPPDNCNSNQLSTLGWILIACVAVLVSAALFLFWRCFCMSTTKQKSGCSLSSTDKSGRLVLNRHFSDLDAERMSNAHHGPLLASQQCSAKAKPLFTASNAIHDAASCDDGLQGHNLPCLFHPAVPSPVRWSLLVLIIGNMVLFASLNFFHGADIYLYITLGEPGQGAEIITPSISDFNLGNSIRQFWSGNARLLAVIIAIASGTLPFLKLLAMLCCWTLPPHRLLPSTRGRVMEALDAIGKWSLVDVFMMILMLVAFNLDFVIGPLHLEIHIIGKLGFNGYIVATIISLVLGHVLLHFHRKIMRGPVRHFTLERPLPLSRSSMPFSARTRVSCTLLGNILLNILLLLALALLIIGCLVDAFAFSIEGLAGWVLGFEVANYSVLTFTKAIASAAGGGFTGLALQITFVVFALLMPLLYLLGSLIMWNAPLQLSQHVRLFKMLEVCFAWSSMEVFAVTVVVSLLELPQLIYFMIGEYCEGFNQLLDYYLDDYLHGDNVCLSMETELLPGAWLLFGSGLIFVLVCIGFNSFLRVLLASRLAEEVFLIHVYASV